MGRHVPPLFLMNLSRLSSSDKDQLKYLSRGRCFDPSITIGAAERCRFGHVRVLACAPISSNLRPFPTTFWLVCPWLTRRAGAAESGGGVRELETWLSDKKQKEWQAYNRFHQILRLSLLPSALAVCLRSFKPALFDGLRLGGVGGIRCDGHVRVKCLHLQTASWLGLGHHPGAEWLIENGLCGDCGGSECRI